MPKFIIIGPLTRDTILREGLKYHTTGGAVYYQAAVLSKLEVDVTAIITLSSEDEELLNAFPSKVNVIPLFFDETMEFKNIYPDMILITGFKKPMYQKILLNPKIFLKILVTTMQFFYVHYHLRIFQLKPLNIYPHLIFQFILVLKVI